MFKLISKDHLVYFLIIFFSIYFSISYSFEQNAIDGGLVLSELVKYPEGDSVMKAYYLNAWTLLHQFTSILLKLNISIISVSQIILFISSLFFLVGIYLIAKSITSSTFLSFFIALVILFFRKNFGDLDYPTLIFSEHTNGMMSLATITLIFGLIANGNFFLSGFLSIFLICIHATTGLWISGVLIFSFTLIRTFFKNLILDKKCIYGMLFGIFPVLLSFAIFFLNTVAINEIGYNSQTYNVYMQQWEAHRTNYGNLSLLNIEYIIKSLILFFICIFGTKYLSNEITSKTKAMLFTLMVSIILSFLIYFAYKFYNNLFPNFLITVMPTRFALMHSVIGYPIIISIIFIFLQKQFVKKGIKPAYATLLIFFILIAYSISHYKNVVLRSNKFLINIKQNNELVKNNIFWEEVKKSKINGHIITSANTSNDTLRLGLKPILLNPSIIDFIPYLPYTSEPTKDIIEKVYKVSFFNPPVKNMAMIPEDIIQKNFEKIMYNEWVEIFSEFNVGALIVPKNWKIDLKMIFSNNHHAFYKLVE